MTDIRYDILLYNAFQKIKWLIHWSFLQHVILKVWIKAAMYIENTIDKGAD